MGGEGSGGLRPNAAAVPLVACPVRREGAAGGDSSAGGSGGGVIASSSEATPSSLRFTMATGTRSSPSRAGTSRALFQAGSRHSKLNLDERAPEVDVGRTVEELFGPLCPPLLRIAAVHRLRQFAVEVLANDLPA